MSGAGVCRDCDADAPERDGNLRCAGCARTHRERSEPALRAVAAPYTSVSDVLLEWSQRDRGWRVVALHQPRSVSIQIPGIGDSHVVDLCEVRATGPELDLDGIERDRGWGARRACIRACEHTIIREVLRRAAGLPSRLIGEDHDAHLSATIS